MFYVIVNIWKLSIVYIFDPQNINGGGKPPLINGGKPPPPINGGKPPPPPPNI
jgi:hypothetical protein